MMSVYDDGLGCHFAKLFATLPLNAIINNAHAKTDVLTILGQVIPLTITDKVQPNCFTIAPHAGIVDYGRDEVVKLPTWQQLPLSTTLSTISHYLKLSKIDQVVAINNYGLSTNTLSPTFMAIAPHTLRQHAHDRYPKHALIIRSLNRHHHADYMEKLRADGWQFITSRQVYVFDDIACHHHHKGVKRDKKLLNDGRYYFCQATSDDDFVMAQHWYNRLYLDKYSRQNVQFTAQALRTMSLLGIMHTELLVNSDDHRSVGVLGMVTGDGIATAPLVGYDIDSDRRLGLYRRVIAQAMHHCEQNRLPLNLSSGASDFKRLRGGLPVIEYTAVYIRHLPRYRKLPWQLLHQASPHYARLLQHYGL